LVEKGEVIKISGTDGSDHYDFNTDPHYHFVCNKCKSITDIELESIDHINTMANEKFPGKVEGHVTYFYGICADCDKECNE
jgi:Fur family peroxide stress response transcriptional regulator